MGPQGLRGFGEPGLLCRGVFAEVDIAAGIDPGTRARVLEPVEGFLRGRRMDEIEPGVRRALEDGVVFGVLVESEDEGGLAVNDGNAVLVDGDFGAPDRECGQQARSGEQEGLNGFHGVIPSYRQSGLLHP